MSTTHRLLPVYKNANTKPSSIFDFNLTSGLEQYIKNNRKVKIVVKNGEYFLKLESNELIKLDYKDSDRTTIYKQFSLSTFKNLGEIKGKLILDPSKEIMIPPLVEIPTKSPKKASTPSVSRSIPTDISKPPPPPAQYHVKNPPVFKKHTPASRRLIYLLALGPFTAAELIHKTKYAPNDIYQALDFVGLPYSEDQLIKDYPSPKFVNDDDHYVLDYKFYKDLQFFESRMYDDNEKRQLITNCFKVFDYLNYSKNHPAREYIERNKSYSRLMDNDKKRKRRDDDNDDEEFYRNLARNFKLKYKEYEDLYFSIQNNKDKNDDDLKKLYELHKDLSSWKKQLWNSVS